MPPQAHPELETPSPEVANVPVAATAIGLMVTLIIAVGGLSGIYVWQIADRAIPAPQQLPAPQVRTDERALRQQLETAQRARLSDYHWADAQKTLIAIPIDRAMQILAARGAKAYDPIIAPQTIGQSPGTNAAAAMQQPDARVPASRQPARSQSRANAP